MIGVYDYTVIATYLSLLLGLVLLWHLKEFLLILEQPVVYQE